MKPIKSVLHSVKKETRKTAVVKRRPVTWSEIERTVLLRIARKEYMPGQKIPTCEVLATELGANKNTVSKAYRSLAQRGYLLTRAGFGTFIGKRRVRLALDDAMDGITGLLSLALQEAKLSGLDQVQFRRFVEEIVAQAYSHTGPRIGFVDCNRHDATLLSRDLQSSVAHPIEPLLLEAVVANPQRFLSEYSILAVDITHLAAVEVALGKHRADEKYAQVIGLHIPIDPDSLLHVARLRKGTRVGIVCDLKQTLLSLTGMVEGCNPGLRIDGCMTKERAAIRKLLAWSDVLLITPSAAEHMPLSDSQVPIVTLAFRPDARSVDQLMELIVQRMPVPVSPDFQSASNARRMRR